MGINWTSKTSSDSYYESDNRQHDETSEYEGENLEETLCRNDLYQIYGGDNYPPLD